MNGDFVGAMCYAPPPVPLTGFGAWVVTSKREIQNSDGKDIDIDDIGNGKAWVINRRLDPQKCRTGFPDRDLTERTHAQTLMLGAICGDIAGSVYERHNIKYVLETNRIIAHNARFTDDSVMTVAVAEGIKNALTCLKKKGGFTPEDEPVFLACLTRSVHEWGNLYPHAGYGRSFRRWLASPTPEPYGSWGNGSAMRASYAGWIADSLADAEYLATVSAKITHNHPEGIKGAVAVAGSLFLLRNCMEKRGTVEEAKRRVMEYVGKRYDMNFTLDEIRPTYGFHVACQRSVPQAIRAFLEGNSFSEVLALAISIGGDSDTLAAIAGSLAEAVYPVPEGVRNRVLRRLDPAFKSALAGTIDFCLDMKNGLGEFHP